VIKSELVRDVVLRYILTQRAFKTVPMLENGLVDIPTLLTSVLYCFDPTQAKEALKTKWKTHESNTSRRVPSEAVYTQQFTAILQRTLITPEWKAESEAESEGDDGKKLDLLLYRQGIEGRRALRVGIEFVASSAPKTIRQHGFRPYPQLMNLDQYVVVHCSPHETKTDPPYFCDGFDKEGRPEQVQVYHVYHNEDFSRVRVVSKASPNGRRITQQLVQ